MTTLGEYYAQQFTAGRLYGLEFGSKVLSLISLVWLLALAYLIIRADSKRAENRFMAILIACEGFKAAFFIKNLTPNGPDWWYLDQYLWNFNTTFFISAHVCSIGLYLCFPIYYHVKQLSFLYSSRLQAHAWYVIPLLTLIFMLVTTDLWLYENYGWLICEEVGVEPVIQMQMGSVSPSLQSTIDSVGNCPQTGVWDIEDTPVIGFLMMALSPMVSIVAIVVMRASMKQYEKVEDENKKNSLTSRSLYIGFLGKVIGNMMLFVIMFLVIPALHGGTSPSLGDALVDGLDPNPSLAQIISDYCWMLIPYLMVLPFAFEGMMFAHASMKDTVLGIDSKLRRTFRNSMFTGLGAFFFIIGSEVMESVMGYGVIGGVLLGSSVMLVRKPIITTLDKMSAKIIPSTYTETETAYLKAYSAAGMDGVISDSERGILTMTAEALGITVERTAELEAMFNSGDEEEPPTPPAEPQVVQQWTDEHGYTWRSMDDGTTLWWTGTDWKKY
ncbi:MAG: hypothetical protein QF839_04880 [Candidatus Poseidoniaceae archaeon]|nr:hypothetical protein [Candidatus Poseidoniaceae archaeon]